MEIKIKTSKSIASKKQMKKMENIFEDALRFVKDHKFKKGMFILDTGSSINVTNINFSPEELRKALCIAIYDNEKIEMDSET